MPGSISISRQHTLNWLFLSGLVLICYDAGASKNESLTIYGSELPPYIGSEADHLGVVHELLVRIFAVGRQDIDISFYPTLRALPQAKRDRAMAALTLSLAGSAQEANLSDPLITIELVKVRLKNGAKRERSTSIVGIAQSSVSASVRQQLPFANIEEINSNLQILRMLQARRIDFAIMDKFIAANLVVEQLPQLISKLFIDESNPISVDIRLAFTDIGGHAKDQIKTFNRALSKLKSSGQYAHILRKFGLWTARTDSTSQNTIRIATVNNTDMLRLRTMSALYEQQNPDIDISWYIMPEDVLRLRLLSNNILNNQQYDVVTISANEAALWAEKGWLEPFNSLPDEYDAGDILEPIRNLVTYQGLLFALPFYGESSVLYYRKDLFAQQELTMPEQPSYDDIERFARALHDPKNGIYGVCLRTKPGFGANVSVVVPMVNSYGGRWFDMQWNPQLTSSAWKSALQRYITLLRNWGPENLGKRSYLSNLELMAGGHCAMWVDATVAAGYLFDPATSKVHDRVAVTNAPIGQLATGYHWLYAWVLAVPASSSRDTAAMDFVTWATSKRYHELVQQKFGVLAIPPGVRFSNYRNPDYLALAPFAPIVLQSILSANSTRPTYLPIPYIGIHTLNLLEFPTIGNKVGWNIYRALQGKITVDEALQESQQFISELKVRRSE